MSQRPPPWLERPLVELSHDQWEALCDGCGRCCLVKLEDEDSGELYFTRAACRLLDLETARCGDYAHRCQRVPDCLQLGPDQLDLMRWMPASCAYKRRAAGLPLAPWHPLLSGRAESVLEAGISVLGEVAHESGQDPDDLIDEAFDWDV